MRPLAIWQPRYSRDDALILCSKIHLNAVYNIYFTKAKHLAGKRYVLRGHQIAGYPKEKLKQGTMYAIPMSELAKYEAVEIKQEKGRADGQAQD